jgi:hypothetical protein
MNKGDRFTVVVLGYMMKLPNPERSRRAALGQPPFVSMSPYYPVNFPYM